MGYIDIHLYRQRAFNFDRDLSIVKVECPLSII